MSETNQNIRRDGGDDHPEPGAEHDLYLGLLAAGLVKPCANIRPDSVKVPRSLHDTSTFMAKWLELERDAEAAARLSTDEPCPESLFPPESARALSNDEPWTASIYPPSSERLAALLSIVAKAFCDVRGDWSTDRVIADPELGDIFLRRCWELGARASAYELNWTLLYGRKNGRFAELVRARRFSVPRARMDEFCFASEIAARYIQDEQWHMYRRSVSLDKILCDPVLAGQFDSLASQIAPRYSVLEYRWAALSLRKAQRSLPGALRLRLEDFEDLGPTDQLKLSQVSQSKGIYCFSQEGKALFIGHTESLRRQVSIHFDHCGTRVIPAWLDNRISRVELSVAPLAGHSSSRRELLRARQISSRKPQFNWMNESAA